MAERAGNSGNSRASGHKRSPRGGQPQKARAAGKSQALRRERRLALPRVANALAKAAAERARIEALIERTTVPVLDTTVEVEIQQFIAGRLVTVADERPPVALVDLTNRAEGDRGWTLAQARSLFREGYHLSWVCKRTGWGGWWFADLIHTDGYPREIQPPQPVQQVPDELRRGWTTVAA